MARRAVVEKSIRVYAAMAERAEQDDEGNLIYTGYLTQLFSQELGYSVPHFSQVTTELKRMGCIEQIQRGTAAQPSKWYLLQEPTDELYERMPQPSETAYGGAKWQKQIEQTLRDYDRRLKKLEANQGEIIEDAS